MNGISSVSFLRLRPIQKFTTEITCHVPAGMTALSNGRLVSEGKGRGGIDGGVSLEPGNSRTPIILLSLVAGYFKKVEDKYSKTCR